MIILMAVGSWSRASAQNTDSADAGLKTVKMVRTNTPPVLDGLLDEEVWSRASVIEDFHQIQPNEYAQPSALTQTYMLYDEQALYLGVRLWEEDPEAMIGYVLRQGELFQGDDHFGVILDPFNIAAAATCLLSIPMLCG